MPVNGDDLPAATALVELGVPAMAPILRDMVRWMRLAESPVADAFADYFAKVGAPALDVVAEGLMRENGWFRHRAFSRILPHSPPELIGRLRDVLSFIATQPDAQSPSEK